MKKQPTFRQRIITLVSSRAETSITTMVARLGKYVPHATAAAYGRRVVRSRNEAVKSGTHQGNKIDNLPLATLLKWGKREYLTRIVADMTREGRLTRIRKGVYGPPPPKLYTPKAV